MTLQAKKFSHRNIIEELKYAIDNEEHAEHFKFRTWNINESIQHVKTDKKI